ncbi:GGDEF domain-containing protein [Aeromonas veronii]|uniref:GGDEF domain-containing protein n=1 Tax=Aeromonas veronii TaxID=654 RepID=UPI00191D5B53|nr:GGDEF domain-containing protein [Aeromonas veronii]MBL0466465.1 membrane-associated sensor domain-containing protein [Aeromonas veronii]MCX9105034.1 GGDEF domain-containing protein [Aeromonas veronii]MCX9120884.1 GGDEF domain-containing protein [Aeromonas veronii]
MLSAAQLSTPPTLVAHLDQARRQAIARGMVWFWLLQWLMVLFLAIRYEVYRQAGLASDSALPWRFQSELGFVMVALLLLPVIGLFCDYLNDRAWLRAASQVTLVWGCVWAVHLYTLGQVELRGGLSFSNGIMRLNLLAAMIAFYPSWKVFYGYVFGSLLLGIWNELYLRVDFPQLYMLGLGCGLVVLEVGRRMLHRWFELAIMREHENLTLLRQLDQLAKQDPLTGVANRRHFNIELDRALAHSQESGAPLSLILIDVDYFKRFNDHYGHQVGDMCLKEVAQALNRAVRTPSDLVARYGGEEFVLLLPHTDRQAAASVAQRLQDGLASLQLEHLASDVAPWVTVSQGIASTVSGEGASQLLERADQALYRAKESGRNQFCVAE